MTYFEDFDPGMPHSENEYARFWIDGNILFFVYKANVTVDLEAAEMIVSDRIALQKGKAYPVFCDTRGIDNIDKRARDYLAREGSVLARAVSMLVDPSRGRSMGDFYLKTNRPVVPTEFFTDRQKALQFLEPFTP